MDADEIRTLLGDNIFERAKKYRKRIQQSTCKAEHILSEQTLEKIRERAIETDAELGKTVK